MRIGHTPRPSVKGRTRSNTLGTCSFNRLFRGVNVVFRAFIKGSYTIEHTGCGSYERISMRFSMRQYYCIMCLGGGGAVFPSACSMANVLRFLFLFLFPSPSPSPSPSSLRLLFLIPPALPPSLGQVRQRLLDGAVDDPCRCRRDGGPYDARCGARGRARCGQGLKRWESEHVREERGRGEEKGMFLVHTH